MSCKQCEAIDKMWPPIEYYWMKNENHTDAKIQNAEPKRDQAAALGAAANGKASSLQPIIISFTGCRTKPLDPDNFAGGCKDLLDGLRHAGLIPNDDPTSIEFRTSQIKVAHRKDECTVIEIEYPE